MRSSEPNKTARDLLRRHGCIKTFRNMYQLCQSVEGSCVRIVVCPAAQPVDPGALRQVCFLVFILLLVHLDYNNLYQTRRLKS